MEFEQADRLNHHIRTISIRHRSLAAELMAPLGIYPGQEVLLFQLDAYGSRTQAQLAEGCGCEAPTITVTARKLESAGLITRKPSPTDGRAIVVELSDLGKSIMPGLRAAWVELAEWTLAAFATTPPDIATTVLAELAMGLGPVRADPRCEHRGAHD